MVIRSALVVFIVLILLSGCGEIVGDPLLDFEVHLRVNDEGAAKIR